MRIILSIVFLFFSSVIAAQKPAESVIAIKSSGSKFQFVNPKTRVPVDGELWDEAESFVNGFARVLRNNKFSFVHTGGKLIAPVEFAGARNFLNNRCAVQKDDLWGFIDATGKAMIPFSYNIVFDFVQPTVTVAFGNKKWWLINNKGAIIKQLDITVCYGFKNGIAKVTKENKEGMLYPDGRIIWNGLNAKAGNSISWQPNSNNLAAPCPDNLGFEFGDFTNWNCFAGSVDSVGTTNVITVTPSAPIPGRHTVYPRVMPSAIDPFGLFPINPPDGSNFAVKLGNTIVGAEAERISYTIHVPLNDTNFSIKYDYAVVFEDPGHTIWTQPRFISRLIDSATNTSIDCASFEYISTSGLPGFIRSTVDTTVMFKSWASVFYSLRGYGGQTLYLEFTNADCVRRGHWGYAYIDVQSTCGSPVEVHYDCTPPNATTLTAPPGFEFYNWWNFDFTTLLGTGQQLNMNPGPAINTVIWVEMIPFSNFGCQDTLMININGDFDAEFDMSAANGCAPQTFTFYNRNLPSLNTFWDFGDGSTATGDTVTHTYTIPGNYNVTFNVTMPGGCFGNAIKLITIYPIPTIVKPANQALCNGIRTSAITFTGTPPGTVFNWTNDNPSIGLAASGTGNIGAFTAINTGNTPVTAIITVTPTHLTCTGTPETFSITVNPIPNVTQPANQLLCSGATTNAIAFTGTVSGTTFSWTNNNPSIGLAASGSGDIPAFTAVNNGSVNAIATITVTPADGICPGTARTFTITVKPTPNVVQPSNQTVCNNGTVGVINFSGTVSGTGFNWTNDNTSIGLAASGSGNIPSFTGVNTGVLPATGFITVTPIANGCPGSARFFTITVNPTPNVAQPANQAICNAAPTNAINFTGAVAATSFIWTNNNTSIGLAASGNGDIPSFTAINTTNAPTTANINVLPIAYGCPGALQSFTITVNPTPNVDQPGNITVCGNATIGAINFSGSVSGTGFSWTNDNTSIGLAASGNGNIPSFTGVNTGILPATGFITVTPTANGCPGNARFFTITVNPTPNVVQPANQLLCNAAPTNAVNFTGSVAATSFIWTNNNTSIGLAVSGTGDIPSFTAINTTNATATAIINVLPIAYGCPGTLQSFTIAVNPTPNVVQPANQSLCNNATTNAINFSGAVSGTGFSWTNNNTSIGLAASGNGNIPSFTATNSTNAPVMATITVTPLANGCPGPSQSFTITVNPTPNVVQPANQVLCNNAATGTVNFTGSVSGTSFGWTNDNTTIGLAASGTGDIPSFLATNVSNVAVTATITVTPLANGCPGAAQSFTITVNPTPNIAVPASQTVCNGAATNAINFTGAVSGTNFTWSNNNPSIGLAGSGTGNIPSFTALNTTNAPVIAIISVAPFANGCQGPAQSFTITVTPTPDVTQPVNQNLCNGSATNAVNFSGNVSNTVFNWTNNNTSIGLAAGGTGNIPAFTAINTTNAPVTATITVTPTAYGCPGAAQSFTIIVNPTPNVVQPASQILCNATATNAINFTGAVSGTGFNWTNNNTAIGLAAGGSGDIPSFTAINLTNAPVTATITISPSANGCTGTVQSFTITVNPTPNVVQPAKQVLCNNATTNTVNFTGNVSGSSFSWTNDNISIGLAASGTGDIPSFTATNTTNAPITATITVIPSANSCVSVSRSFTITVNPTPNVVQPVDQRICNGFAANAINFSGNVTGTSFNWTNNNPSIGLASSGTGNIPAFTGINTGSTPASATIIVTPSAKGCTGLPKTVIVRVDPVPTVELGADLTLSTGTVTNLNAVIQNGPIANWVWTPATGLSCTNCPSPVLTVTNDITYNVVVTNIYGCVARDNITISTFCRNSQVFVPNAFTPDGDGLNDVLMVRGKGIFVTNFRIFNRWGELVFQKSNFNPNDKQFGWDGKVRGVLATPDVFVYTAEVVCDNGIKYTYKGNTTLLK
ncbi:MAG: gliding motility-associated C-terminal domain-containing protein [Chitinophagaceae bacterium]|nr:gliding motility-associated C-terminal domain-containing protein [Chitinophagaceae bacterium]